MRVLMWLRIMIFLAGFRSMLARRISWTSNIRTLSATQRWGATSRIGVRYTFKGKETNG